MKKLLLLFFIIWLSCAGTKAPAPVLSQAETLRAEMDSLRTRVTRLELLYQTWKPDTVRILSPVPTASATPQPDSSAGPPETAKRKQCQAMTKSGKRCTRMAKPGRPFCWQHDH